MNPSVIDVAIVEDHTVFRQALAAAIAGAPDMAVAGMAEDVEPEFIIVTEFGRSIGAFIVVQSPSALRQISPTASP